MRLEKQIGKDDRALLTPCAPEPGFLTVTLHGDSGDIYDLGNNAWEKRRTVDKPLLADPAPEDGILYLTLIGRGGAMYSYDREKGWEKK